MSINQPVVPDLSVCVGFRECLGEAHEPASCEHWKKWHAKIAEVRPEECKCPSRQTMLNDYF